MLFFLIYQTGEDDLKSATTTTKSWVDKCWLKVVWCLKKIVFVFYHRDNIPVREMPSLPVQLAFILPIYSVALIFEKTNPAIKTICLT